MMLPCSKSWLSSTKWVTTNPWQKKCPQNNPISIPTVPNPIGSGTGVDNRLSTGDGPGDGLKGKTFRWYTSTSSTASCETSKKNTVNFYSTSSAWNAKCPILLGNVTPKTSNYCLKNRALGFPGGKEILHSEGVQASIREEASVVVLSRRW